MSKPTRKGTGSKKPDLRDEYAFDYGKARPNRFAAAAQDSSVVVVLDGELARIFRTPESVKAVLRALVDVLPERPAADRGS